MESLLYMAGHEGIEEALRESEAQYRSLFTSMNEGCAIHDVVYDSAGRAIDYIIRDVNPAFEAITGLKREAAAGRKASELYGTGESPYLERFATVAASGEPVIFETMFEPMGKSFRISVSSPSRGKFVTVFEDITERKETEEALRAANEQLNFVLGSITDAYFSMDAQWRFLRINPVAERAIFRRPASELLGKVYLEVFPHAVDSEFMRQYRKAIAERRPVHFEAKSAIVEGSWFEAHAYPRNGVLEVYVRDISKRKHAEEALQNARDELEKRVGERTADLARTVETLQGEINERIEIEEALRKSEERYALAMLGVNDGIWDWDFETGESYVSPRWKSMLGYAEDELQGIVDGWKGIIHPDDFAGTMAHLDAYLAGRIPEYTLEYRLRNKEGSYRWILTRGTCIRDANGKPLRMAGSHTDITERKLAEEKILRLNRHYEVMSEIDKAIVRTVDRDSLFREICRIIVDHGGFKMAWIGLVDWESSTVKPVVSNGKGTKYLDSIRISVREEPEGMGPVGTAIREGSYSICNDFQSNPRSVPWHGEAKKYGFRAAASIAMKQNGNVIGALTFYADEMDFFRWQLIKLLEQMATEISFALDKLDLETRRREAERALQQEMAERMRTLEELRRKDRMLMLQSRQAAMGEMIGNIAHQWRQPLNTLGLIVQQLVAIYEAGLFDEKTLKEETDRAMKIIFHMSQTIDDFRNFFRPDKEKVIFNANRVVAQTLSLIDGSFKNQGIRVTLEIRDELPIAGYPNEFSQVLLNILLNARDVLSERDIDNPRVTVTLLRENDKAIVTVADNAGGIAAEIMDRIFDPYFTTKGPDRGTGVGLYMSKTIIEKNMNGRLTARNVNGGAEFRIEVGHGEL